MKSLLTATAAIEAGGGLGLVARPSLVTALLLGSSLDTAAGSTLARVAGVALLTLAVACWLARLDAQSRAARGVVSAMTLYNAAVLAILVYASTSAGVSGVALWPAVLVHATMAAWCVTCLTARGGPSQ